MNSMSPESDAEFDRSAKVYDLLYADKRTAEEVDYIVELLSRFNVRPGASLLEFGCGTGRHARELVGRGFSVTGIERSPQMAGIAIAQGLANTVIGDVRSTMVGKGFDAVIALFHVVSYQSELDALLETFENASRHLRSAGLFIFDAWFTPAVMAMQPEERARSVKGDGGSVRRTATPVEDVANSLVDVAFTYEYQDDSAEFVENWTEVHRMRHLTLTEVRLLARDSNLELVLAEEWLSGAAPSRETWGVTFVLRKTA